MFHKLSQWQKYFEIFQLVIILENFQLVIISIIISFEVIMLMTSNLVVSVIF